MKHHCALAAALILTPSLLSSAEVTPPLAGLVYHPEGDAIALRNGSRWDNRPLYCHERMAIVYGGEMPSLRGRMGTLYAGIQRGDKRIPLHHFAERLMRYRPGRIEWEFSDPALPGLKALLVGTTLADATGFTARLTVEGALPGDQALWCLFPPDAEKGGKFQVRTTRSGYQFEPEPAAALSSIRGSLSADVVRWEQLPYATRDGFSGASPLHDGIIAGSGLIAIVPLTKDPQSVAVATDDNEGSYLTRLNKPLNPSAVENAAAAFDLGLARVQKLGESVKVETPDPYLNAAAGASVAASYGLFVHECFVHGGSMWRYQMPGWRTMGGAISYGWTDQVRRAVKLYDGLQIKHDTTRRVAEFSENGAQQWGNSRFFGEGFVHYKQPALHYEFQTLMFDDAVRAWRHTADPVLEKHLLPMLELHLKRARECFDADDDGLYESYNNTWPNDSIWFNGGGTPEQSAYIYAGHRAAADMCRRAGDASGTARHEAQATKIHTALNRLLWLPEAGHFGSFLEPGGHRRVNPNAWVYAQHVPIEARMTTPEQAWKAMFYTEWAMERVKLPFGGEMRQTSNFVPGQWSIRELYHGDNFAMALGYFLAGQGDDGWEILRGTMLQSMYGDLAPKKGFSQESGNFNRVNLISPGGLSQPNCGIDFNDIASSFARTLVEGLFGYRPDYPNRVVRIEPSFPSSWRQASIRTPEFALKLANNTWLIELTQPAALKIGLPVRAKKIRAVFVNGKATPFTIEPWTGFGMLRLEVPTTARAEVKLDLEGESPDLPVKSAQQSEGQPGHHLVLEKIAGDVPRYQVTKLHVTGTPGLSPLREAPANALWKPIDISAHHNGDLRTIYQQRYDAPRPATCSMRIAFDGWSAWTFPHWGIKTPTVAMEQALAGADPLVTPQRAHFLKPKAEKNIAFTSLWDNWPDSVTVPVDAKGEAVWLLVAGTTNPMQGKIANAVVRFRYADGVEESLDLTPPDNFWSLCGFGRVDYNYERDGFALPKLPPAQVQLGTNCRAMVYGWKLRPGIALKEIQLETLSQEVVIGLMGVSIQNPH